MDQAERIQLTTLLRESSEDGLSEEAWEMIYPEVMRLARAQRRRWSGDWTMETSALANEVFIKVFSNGAPDFNDRRHFYRLVATAIRQILVNYSAARGAAKRGGRSPHVSLDVAEALGVRVEAADRARDVHDALERFRELDQRAAEVVELKFFVGLGNAEIADVLGVSRPTVIRDWAAAKAWLWKEIGDEGPGKPGTT